MAAPTGETPQKNCGTGGTHGEESKHMSQKKRVLVTGAAGFIASHIAEAYHAEGHVVAGLDNLSTGNRDNLPSEIPLHVCDLANEAEVEAVFKEFQPEVINHHAAQINVRTSWDKPRYDAQTNIMGTLTLLRNAIEAGTEQIIYSSSGGAIYGEMQGEPVKEECLPQPLSNYGVSKYAVELYLQSFHASSSLRYVILRYPNIFGPRQDPGGEAGVVAIFATQMLQGKPLYIFGDGSKTRDYLYIDDVVDANLRALKYGECGVFNLGWGKEITDLEVYQAVREAVGADTKPIYTEKRPGEIEHICIDATRAGEALGWKPSVDFAEGVRRVVEYWRERLGDS